jgi:hypothetical protein
MKTQEFLPDNVNNNKEDRSSDPPLLFDNRYRESEKRKNGGPWTFFQGRLGSPTSKHFVCGQGSWG